MQVAPFRHAGQKWRNAAGLARVCVKVAAVTVASQWAASHTVPVRAPMNVTAASVMPALRQRRLVKSGECPVGDIKNSPAR